MSITRMNRRGQITIPKAFRAAFKIQPNEEIEFFVSDNRTCIVPVRVSTERQRDRLRESTVFPMTDEEKEKMRESLRKSSRRLKPTIEMQLPDDAEWDETPEEEEIERIVNLFNRNRAVLRGLAKK